MLTLPAGTTEYMDVMLLEDGSGDPVTGLTATDLTVHYYRQGAAANQAVTVGDLSALDDAWAAGANDSDVLEIDATDNPGKYLIHLPDEAFAAGAGFVTFTVKGTGAKHWQQTYQIDNSVRVFNPAAGDSAGETTLNLPSSLPLHDGSIVQVIGGTGAGSSFVVRDYSTPAATTIYRGLAAAIGTDSVCLAIAAPVGGDQVRVTHWVDTAVSTPNTGGVPIVEVEENSLLASLGMAGSDLDTQLDAINALVVTLDGIADAIKAKTDSLTFSGAGFVDANVMEVNDNGGLDGDGDGTPVGKA